MIAGVFCAVFMIVAMGLLLPIFILPEPMALPVSTSLLIATPGAIVFGGAMGGFFYWMMRRVGPLGHGADPRRVHGARRLVKAGRLGDDPAANALAVKLAHQYMRVPWFRRLSIAVFGIALVGEAAMAVFSFLQGDTFMGAFFTVAAVLFLLALTVLLPYAERARRRAQQVIDQAAEREGPDPESPASPMG